jgi:sugar lactone lactonase YvrE
MPFLVLALSPMLSFGQTSYAPYTFTTLAGAASQGSADGVGAAARFANPTGVAVDAAGRVLVVDNLNSTIRAIASDGTVATVAGLAGVKGSADGTGSAARFFLPEGVAVDATGNVYIADTVASTIRRISPGGAVTTLAGSAGASGSTDGAGSSARFSNPEGIAVDGAGNVYVADTSNLIIRKITPNGVVSTLAGTANTPGSADGAGAAARFSYPTGIAVDHAGYLYVADEANSTIRKITPGGVVSTLAGQAGVQGSADGAGAAARFSLPRGVAVDAAGNLYVADISNHTVRKITPTGVVTTVAGQVGFSGSNDGNGSSAQFGGPFGLTVDAAGNLFVADAPNNTIRRISAAGSVTTLAGLPPSLSPGSIDGVGPAARFNGPCGLAADAAGNIYAADSANHTIRRIAPDGAVSTIAGLAGAPGSADGAGDAARFRQPQGLAVDPAGNVYVADMGNHTIRKIGPDRTVSTVAGLAEASGSADGVGSNARFGLPQGVTIGTLGNVFVADTSNSIIRKIAPDGTVSTLAGLAGVSGSIDGTGSAARFNRPSGIIADAAGNLYVGDYAGGLGVIRKISPDGLVTTFARVDPTPVGLSMDAAGNIFVVATDYCVIEKIMPQGAVAVLAGNLFDGTSSRNADGTGTAARFNYPQGIAVDSTGNVYVADTGNNTIRKGQPYIYPIIMTPPASRTVTGGQSATFSVAAGSTSPVTYQWQRQSNGSAAWSNLTDGATYSGTASATLTVSAITAAMNGDAFRCVVSNATGSVNSAPATLTVVPSPPMVVATLAGLAGTAGAQDGSGSGARFSAPADLAVDLSGHVYVADTNNQTIRRISSTGTVTTLAGMTASPGYADGTGAGASFAHPAGVAVDGAGNVYVSDTDNSVIRKITPAGVVTTLAGAHAAGSADGTGSAARFNGPSGIVADATGNLYVSDTLNNTIRKITPEGTVTTVAWQTPAGAGFARLSGPQGLALDRGGNLYIADTNENAIRKIVLSTATLTAVAGSGGFGSDDGPAAVAQFYYPSGVAVDRGGNIYVADTDHHTIRQISPAGVVSTVAGLAGVAGSADGVGTAARFNHPSGLAVDDAGNLYIADTDNHTIRVAYFSTAPVILAQPQSQTATAGTNVQFSVTAVGTPVPTCQWSFNGAPIAGATGSSLSLGSVQSANAGNYTVTVTNSSGSATSNAATLTVNAAAPAPSTGGNSGSSGGGALEGWFTTALALMAAARGMTRRAR